MGRWPRTPSSDSTWTTGTGDASPTHYHANPRPILWPRRSTGGLVHTFLGRQQGSWKLEAESGLAMGWTLAGEHVQRPGGRRQSGRWRSHCCWCDWSVRARGRGRRGGRCTQTPGPMAAGQRKPRGACLSLQFGKTRYSVQLKYGSCDDLASSPGQTRGF